MSREPSLATFVNRISTNHKLSLLHSSPISFPVPIPFPVPCFTSCPCKTTIKGATTVMQSVLNWDLILKITITWTKYGTITHSRPLGCNYAFSKVELLPLSTRPEYVWVYSEESWHTVCIIFKPYKYLVAAPAVIRHLLSFTVRDVMQGKMYLHSSCEDSNSFLAPRAAVLCGLQRLPRLAASASKNHSPNDV